MRDVMWMNGITSGHIGAVKIAPTFATDRDVLTAALESLPHLDSDNTRFLWITSTRDLLEVDCSEAYLHDAESRPDLSILGPPKEIQFDLNGHAIRPGNPC